ncbi:hypothetical protein BDN72DRAFT_961382 [Pluteus cervinus]|uniref:Uncharacterized protein n=1 Tax=Pluteus cervinus TaxID=181527 RepID=A0ACD3ANM5_9AGAR|nr:hypothetical protein BDN72DRAFT_961382 [Pluteus cervinus]
MQIPRFPSLRKPQPVPISLTVTPDCQLHDPEKRSIDVPNELWFKIFDLLDIVDLNLLGRVSRQLNSLVTSTPPYSTRFENISESIDITLYCLKGLRPYYGTPIPTVDDIDILSLMLNIGSVNHLTCTLDCPTTTAISTISLDYRRLTRFIQRLPNLRRITLKLEPSNGDIRPSGITWVGWEDSLSSLLNACIERGCTSFELSEGNYPQNLYLWGSTSFNPIGLLRLVPSMRKRLVYWHGATRWGVGWDVTMDTPLRNHKLFLPYRPSLMLNDVSDGHRQFIQSSLTTLDIGTPLLVHPPFSNWTYHVIVTTPSLTTLAIRNIPFGEKRDLFWRALLSWLLEALKFHNVLKSLTIENCPYLPTERILLFAQQFKDTLTDLKLLCNVTPLPKPAHLREVELDLPNLESLSTSWPMAMRLADGYVSLAQTNSPGARTSAREREMLEYLKYKFPALESLTIDDQVYHETDGKRLSIFRLKKY